MTTARRYLLERVGDAAVVQLYADGFSEYAAQVERAAAHAGKALSAA